MCEEIKPKITPLERGYLIDLIEWQVLLEIKTGKLRRQMNGLFGLLQMKVSVSYDSLCMAIIKLKRPNFKEHLFEILREQEWEKLKPFLEESFEVKFSRFDMEFVEVCGLKSADVDCAEKQLEVGFKSFNPAKWGCEAEEPVVTEDQFSKHVNNLLGQLRDISYLESRPQPNLARRRPSCC